MQPEELKKIVKNQVSGRLLVSLPFLVFAVLAYVMFGQNVFSDKLKASVNEPQEKIETPFEVPAGLVAVTKVVDGDTIHVLLDGKDETVRIIGINTPETVDPRREVECFGREASAKSKELLEGRFVELTADPTQDDRDKYGRLLRYVHLEDGTDIGLTLIENGFAFEYTYKVPYANQALYQDAQTRARAAKTGLWAPDACS